MTKKEKFKLALQIYNDVVPVLDMDGPCEEDVKEFLFEAVEASAKTEKIAVKQESEAKTAYVVFSYFHGDAVSFDGIYTALENAKHEIMRDLDELYDTAHENWWNEDMINAARKDLKELTEERFDDHFYVWGEHFDLDANKEGFFITISQITLDEKIADFDLN